MLPAINWQEIWLVDAAVCASSTPEECDDKRGNTFNYNSSSSFSNEGVFRTDLAKDLGIGSEAVYGQDTVGLGNQNSGATLERQVVVSQASDDFYLGVFGLGDQPTNFTDFNDPQPSFLTSLFDKGLIPSLSWGYHVGARWSK